MPIRLLTLLLAAVPALPQVPVTFPTTTLSQKKISGVGTDCTDRDFRLSFRLPPRWSVVRQSPWNDGGEPATTIVLRDPQSNAHVSLYYRETFTPHGTPEDATRRLRQAADSKTTQRLRELSYYRVRPQSYTLREVGGQPALSWIADYTDGKNGMAEYLTYVQSKEVVALFFMRIRGDLLDGLIERSTPLIQSLKLP